MPALQRQIVSSQEFRASSFWTSNMQGWAFTHDINLSGKSVLIKMENTALPFG
jgi:hypothetical protein